MRIHVTECGLFFVVGVVLFALGHPVAGTLLLAVAGLQFLLENL